MADGFDRVAVRDFAGDHEERNHLRDKRQGSSIIQRTMPCGLCKGRVGYALNAEFSHIQRDL